jgi:hypothetical protein
MREFALAHLGDANALVMIHLLNLRLAFTSNYAAGTRPASIRIEPSMCNGVSIGSPQPGACGQAKLSQARRMSGLHLK